MQQQCGVRSRALPRLGLMVFLLCAGFPAVARDSLGIFGGWGAFRDATPSRCYAIAEPVRPRSGARWQPFASVADWPGHIVRDQLHIRLRKPRGPKAPVTLSIGERHFKLVSGGGDAWAPDARDDAAIVAAMRSGSSMSVETVDSAGRPLVDVYRLRGAATAIDAAALACAHAR